MNSDLQKSICCAVARPSNATAQQKPPSPATDSATQTQRISLKALANAALRRNESRNDGANEGQNHAQQMGQKSALFDADCCAPVASEIGPSPSGNDHPPANDPDDQAARLKALPSDLVRLAIRYCVELHADSPEQVLEMLEDLLAVPDEWHWWRIRFMKKLRIPIEVMCIDCGHCEDTGGNLGRCLKALPSAGAGGLWWMTDQHPCIEFSPKEAA